MRGLQLAAIWCMLSAPQATVSGFRLVNRENVFRVCDQPHPLLVKEIVGHCGKARLEDAYRGMSVRCRRSSPV